MKIELHYKGEYSHTSRVDTLTDSLLKEKCLKGQVGDVFDWFDISTGHNWKIKIIGQ